MALIFTLDQKIARGIQNLVGSVILGPPQWLGLPSGIWSAKVITEGADNDLDAMKTNFIANRVRRNAITGLMMLSLPLWFLAVVLIAGKLVAFNDLARDIYWTLPDIGKTYLYFKFSDTTHGRLEADGALKAIRRTCTKPGVPPTCFEAEKKIAMDRWVSEEFSVANKYPQAFIDGFNAQMQKVSK